jgi:hypothetical protein
MLPQAAVKDSPAVSKFDTVGKVLIDILVAAFGCSQGFFMCGAVGRSTTAPHIKREHAAAGSSLDFPNGIKIRDDV